MDPDPFECPICLSLFQGSIFQCKNGHAVCEACNVRIHGTCPSCREPIGDIRCRALENAIAGMALPCSFRSNGCTQLLKHYERPDHEAFHCQHAPFACPFQRCTYSGLLLYDHIREAHTPYREYIVSFSGSKWLVPLSRNRPFEALLDQVDRRVFLLLNSSGVSSGRSLSVVCLGPRPAANQLLEYKLEVGGAGQHGTLSLSACSVACMRSWAGQYPDRFLFVPDAYWTSLDGIPLDRVVNVCVQKSAVNNVQRWTVNNALGSLTTPCSSSEVDTPCSGVNTHWSDLQWLRQPSSLETFHPFLVLLVFVFSITMAAVLALAWKTSSR